MYTPKAFGVDDEAAWELVRDAGAGFFVRAANEGLRSAFAPVVVSGDATTLRAHVARANDFWRDLDEARVEVVILFLAASAYVSPSLYPSREVSPDVVPTWNYAAVEVRGTLRVRDDDDWKREQVVAVTNHFESGRDVPWRVEDVDRDFLARQLRAIVGLEVAVHAIEGKEKLSQNRPEVDRLNVRENFASGSPRERDVARRMRS
ncbi:MAG: FMN-binding negative transcriptional regulator [Acidobacteriota bacterium]|nr:FMN-binding negative transcriptional regulator [Acidobacteriota bacterium]MDE3044328.1 FMN-binding negative transcriptional regulator [Acidobacteriota bacterium]MDE3108224.1 FMN-binding negative transcriptional regulator [Acidobacteriota bacterium]MDE3222746.1 FMN-binding negative transcriptional regulator [Acidobacteriota bacterium]